MNIKQQKGLNFEQIIVKVKIVFICRKRNYFTKIYNPLVLKNLFSTRNIKIPKNGFSFIIIQIKKKETKNILLV